MAMLVDPIRTGDDVTYFETLLRCLDNDQPCTEAVLLEQSTAGARFLLDATGAEIARRASEEAPAIIARNLRDVRTRPRPYIGEQVSYLPHLQRCRLVIIGAGHVGQKVAELAADVGFRIWVADDRDDYCSAERFPDAEKLLVGSIESVADELNIDTNTFCIIVTRGHNHDEAALFQVANSNARYIGMIGSKRKIRLIFEDLRRDGISDEVLKRVHAPLGFDIGSQTVPEIAVSIVAELIACRNLDSPPPGLLRNSLLAEQA